jgi:hypothetical protein
MGYDQGMDIGFQPPDSEGVASYLYGGLESYTDYYVVMTAYNTEGLESDFSNEIVSQALACDPTPCGDGNACTVDACSGSVCTNDPVPEGTSCNDGDPETVQDACFSGICSGVVVECSSDLECGDGNPCTADACSGGVCTNDVVPQGTACDDGDSLRWDLLGSGDPVRLRPRVRRREPLHRGPVRHGGLRERDRGERDGV